ncbi:MAG: hypothetical protein ACXW3D_05190 [Caulobacteraceae bacterium]
MTHTSHTTAITDLLLELLVAQVAQLGGAATSKALHFVDCQLRATATAARAATHIRNLGGLDDNPHEQPDPNAAARAEALRSELERRIARIRADLDAARDAGQPEGG